MHTKKNSGKAGQKNTLGFEGRKAVRLDQHVPCLWEWSQMSQTRLSQSFSLFFSSKVSNNFWQRQLSKCDPQTNIDTLCISQIFHFKSWMNGHFSLFTLQKFPGLQWMGCSYIAEQPCHCSTGIPHSKLTDNHLIPTHWSPSITRALIHQLSPCADWTWDSLSFFLSLFLSSLSFSLSLKKGKTTAALIFLVICPEVISPILRQSCLEVNAGKNWFQPLDMTTEEEPPEWWQKHETVPVFMHS